MDELIEITPEAQAAAKALAPHIKYALYDPTLRDVAEIIDEVTGLPELRQRATVDAYNAACDALHKHRDAVTILKVERDRLAVRLGASLLRVSALEEAIKLHRSHKADDRCIEDDDRLYEVLGDGIKCDRRVGSKEEMLANCKRFIERRCEGGGWPSYAELETKLREAEARDDVKEKLIVLADSIRRVLSP
jgi:hypothetical protein